MKVLYLPTEVAEAECNSVRGQSRAVVNLEGFHRGAGAVTVNEALKMAPKILLRAA
jgi:hypothetical protein